MHTGVPGLQRKKFNYKVEEKKTGSRRIASRAPANIPMAQEMHQRLLGPLFCCWWWQVLVVVVVVVVQVVTV
jgi:hypothetical protein